jgi:hypothetical protein
MSASWQDRYGARTTLLSTYLTSPIRHVFADQVFAGKLVDWAAETLKTTVDIHVVLYLAPGEAVPADLDGADGRAPLSA